MPLLFATVLKLCVAGTLSVVLAVTPAARPDKVQRGAVITQLDTQLVSLVNDTLTALQPTPGAGATPGMWRTSTGCWRCDAGPGVALAAVAAVTRDPAKQAAAERIIDSTIAAHPSGTDINVMFFASEVGVAAIMLKETIAQDRLARWTSAVARSADFLVSNKNLSWYTNGNIVVGNALVMALAYRLTGEQRYRELYDEALNFAVTPPQQRWSGFGFRVVKPATVTRGANGKGYFTETGPGGPGYDPEYTMLQLDQLTRIYLINGDERILQYMNMVLGMLMDRVDVRAWTLDTSGGTRKPMAGRKIVFDTAALTTLANLGGRDDLKPYLADQHKALQTMFRSAFPDFGDRHKYAIGMNVASLIMSEPGNARLR